MAYHNPFDLQYWFVNVFAGNMTIFLAVAFLAITAMAAMFRMSSLIVGIMFSLFVILLGVATGNIMILVVIIVGLIFGWLIARMLQ